MKRTLMKNLQRWLQMSLESRRMNNLSSIHCSQSNECKAKAWKRRWNFRIQSRSRNCCSLRSNNQVKPERTETLNSYSVFQSRSIKSNSMISRAGLSRASCEITCRSISRKRSETASLKVPKLSLVMPAQRLSLTQNLSILKALKTMMKCMAIQK